MTHHSDLPFASALPGTLHPPTYNIAATCRRRMTTYPKRVYTQRIKMPGWAHMLRLTGEAGKEPAVRNR